MRLDKAVSLFLGEHKPTTRKAYACALIPLREFIGPQRLIGDIKPVDLIAFLQTEVRREKRPRYRQQPTPGEMLSAASQRKLIRTVKIFFNWCTRVELIRQEANPARNLTVDREHFDPNDDKAMTDAEMAALVAYVREKTIPRDFALVLFLSDSGCRAGGAAGLRLRDIFWEDLLCRVIEKGEKPRFAAFGAAAAQAMAGWLLYRSEHYPLKAPSLPDAYVFSRDGRFLSPALLSQAVRRACLAIGIRSLGAHSIRHRKGRQLVNNGVPLTVAATALGNTPEVMARYYATRDWASAEKALRGLMHGATPDESYEMLKTWKVRRAPGAD